MRYYVYKDAQILGPLAREDLGEAGGLGLETLVCEEGVSGRRDSDWKCVSDIPELAGLYVPAGAPLALAEWPLSAPESILERLELETLGVPGQEPAEGGWIERLFEDADLKRAFADIFVKTEQDLSELAVEKEKVHGLTEQLEALQSRIGELEEQRRELIRQLDEKSREGPSEPGEAALTTPETAGEEIEFVSPEEIPVPELPEPGVASDLPEPLAEPPAAPLEKKDIEFGPTKTFPLARREAPLRPPMGETPSESIKPNALPEGLPEVSPTSLSPIPEAVPVPEPPPAPPALEPAPLPMTPNAIPEGRQDGGASAPPPVPPMTMTFFGRSAGSGPAAALTPSRANADAVSPPPMRPNAFPEGPQDGAASVPPTQEVIARLAKPATTPQAAGRLGRGSSRMFIGASALLLLGLAAAGYLFFHDSKGINLMFNMGSDRKPLGAEMEEARGAARSAKPPAVAAEGSPDQGFVPEAGQEALRLVKNYPLDGGRGSVGQWLQYSFTANPGGGNQEEWTAGGGVDATTYIVEYRVKPGPNSGVKEPILYLFEADVGRKTVKGSNPPARELLAGGPPVKPQRRKTAAAHAAQGPSQGAAGRRGIRPAVRRKGTPRRPAAARKQVVPLLPLPSDADLLAPAGEGSGFKNGAVRRGQ